MLESQLEVSSSDMFSHSSNTKKGVVVAHSSQHSLKGLVVKCKLMGQAAHVSQTHRVEGYRK